MARPCTVCGHQRRDEIDAALLDNQPYEAIAARFQTSLMSVLTHRSHLDRLSDAAAGPTAAEQARGTHRAGVESLLDQMRALHEKSFVLLRTVESASEPRTISMTLVQVRRNLRALGDLTEHVRQSVRAATEELSSGRSG